MTENLSWSEARDELRKYRETNTRFSERVLEIWEDVICDSQHRLGDEIWVVLEQVCIAAIDCAQDGIVTGMKLSRGRGVAEPRHFNMLSKSISFLRFQSLLSLCIG
jgi:hypothetical protein